MPLQLSMFFYLLSGVFLCTLFDLTISARLYEPLSIPQIGEDTKGSEEPLTVSHELELTNQTTPEMYAVPNLDKTEEFKESISTESPSLHNTNRTTVAPEPPQTTDTPAPPVTTITLASPGEAPHIKSEYPEDFFSIEDCKRGWVILHIIGMLYMFISLAVVCDEFFVPALGVITDKLAISDDVAGATIMAAGRSSPKLFTCIVGVFIDHSNVGVGIGKIVGPAVYNILSVIGVCSLFSREVLHLTWWPLFRDVSFYILALILLIIFFLDNVIMWWESIMLVTSYSLYMTLMKFSVQIEQAFKSQLYIHKATVKAVNLEEPEKRRASAGEDGQEASEDAEHNNIDTHESCRNEEDESEEKQKKTEKPLSLQWPNTRCKQVTYVLLLPIIVPLWLTIPDVRNQKSKKFCLVTFLGSILWIAVFSYFMVWWAHQVGETIGIPKEIMGLTILAAGTSIPDLITSVIVARKGLGDMAVSSSVGCNIFDITVGLPVPWLLYSSINSLAPVAVSSNGLFCAIVLLFIMLLFVIISIASCKWRMNKALGFTMFLLYIIFVGISLVLQYHIIICPVSI